MLSIIDIRELKEKGQKKLIGIYVVFMAATIGLGVWYSLNHRTSFIGTIFSIIGKGKNK